MIKAASAVCIAHPGHELLIHAWLRHARPLVLILTDGSGHSGQPRLEQSRSLLQSMDVPLASGSGRYTDKQLYELIRAGRSDWLFAVANDFAKQLVECDARAVVADAAEGYNPVHDLSRMITGAACALAALAGVELRHFEFAIAEPAYQTSASDDWVYRLTDQELDAKVAAARAYWPLRDEVDEQLHRAGREVLRTEHMRCVPEWQRVPAGARQPLYERIGAERVTAGRYDAVIRYAEHIRPLQRQLVELLEEHGASSNHQRISWRSRRHSDVRS